MAREYTIEVWDSGAWALAHRGVMSRGCAEGMLNQFATDHRARLLHNGKVLTHRGVNGPDTTQVAHYPERPR